MNEPHPSNRGGLLYGLAAYGLWGLAPLYFNALIKSADQKITPGEILAHRIVWSVVVVAFLLTLARRWSMVAACLRVQALRWPLVASATLVGLNWFLYIYSVATHQVVESSLGYFINPLVNVLMGMLFFHERLRLLQWIAIALAVVGVARMTTAVGELPWLALSLAGSFSIYGLLRKKTPVDGLIGLSVETFVLVPLAAGYLVILAIIDGISLGTYGPVCDWLILATGVVTALPLMCFGQAARRLRLSTMGFLQFVSPTLQFLCAVVVLDEPLHVGELMNFTWIWCGLALFAVDSLLRLWAQQG